MGQRMGLVADTLQLEVFPERAQSLADEWIFYSLQPGLISIIFFASKFFNL